MRIGIVAPGEEADKAASWLSHVNSTSHHLELEIVTYTSLGVLHEDESKSFDMVLVDLAFFECPKEFEDCIESLELEIPMKVYMHKVIFFASNFGNENFIGHNLVRELGLLSYPGNYAGHSLILLKMRQSALSCASV